MVPTLYLTSVLRYTSGLNCGRVTILAPKYSEDIRMLVRPYTWKKGSTPSTTSCISPAAIKRLSQRVSKMSSGKSSKAVHSNNINYLCSTLTNSMSRHKTNLFDSLLSYSYIAFIDHFYGLYFSQLSVTNEKCKKSNMFNLFAELSAFVQLQNVNNYWFALLLFSTYKRRLLSFAPRTTVCMSYSQDASANVSLSIYSFYLHFSF